MSNNGMMASLDLAERLGVRGRFTDSTMTGGSSFEVHVEHAAAAIAAGLCEVAGHGLRIHTAQNGRPDPFAGGSYGPMGLAVVRGVGAALRAADAMASATPRASPAHMHEYGTTSRAARPDRGRPGGGRR